MTDMPTKTFLTSGTTTEAEFQSAIGDLYDVVAESALVGPAEAVTIASGVILPTKGTVVIDTEAAAATDDLNLITPTSLGQKVIFIRSTSAARVITLKHMQSGTGRLYLNTLADTELKSPTDFVALMWNATTTRWEELFRNFGFSIQAGTEAAHRTKLGLPSGLVKNNFSSSTNPAVTNDDTEGYEIGSQWVNNTTARLYVCFTAATGAAGWIEIIQGSGTQNMGNKTITASTINGVTPTAAGGGTSFLADDGAYKSVSNPVKAWVVFNGTGTVSIIGSSNVTSITDNGTGDYTVNFTSSLADANYAMASSHAQQASSGTNQVSISNVTAPTAAACRIIAQCTNIGGASPTDNARVSAVFTR